MKYILAFLFTCLCVLSSPSVAVEAIEQFDSQIDVQKDGSLIVTETLLVRHEGKEFKRGIYRDLPTVKREKYTVLEVLRNNNPEPYHVETEKKKIRVYVGSANTYLPAGTSQYKIKYRVLNVPKSFDGYDEVYWNVTGNRWSVPILNVTARVNLPSEAQILQQASYIGRSGSKNPAKYHGDGYFSGGSLNRGEQLTVAVGFTPHIVQTDLVEKQKRQEVSHYLKFFVCLLIVFIVYLGIICYLLGRDPIHPAVMPEYNPPKELTPVQAQELIFYNLASDQLPTIFAQMIESGFITIEHQQVKSSKLFSDGDDKYVIKQTGKQPRTFEEKKFLEFFPSGLNINGKFSEHLAKYTQTVGKEAAASVKQYYKDNIVPVFIGGIIYILLLQLNLIWQMNAPLIYILYFQIVSLFHVMAFFGHPLRRPKKYKISRTSGGVIIGFALIFTFIVSVSIGDDLVLELIKLAFLVMGYIAAAIGSHFIYKPSVQGALLLAQLDGLRLFLKETDYTKQAVPSLNAEDMDKLFPYAVALSLEDEWEHKFKNLFGRDAYEKHMSDRHFSVLRSADFSAVLSSSFTRPHSGSGGGGGAGGGSGGGGGGGW